MIFTIIIGLLSTGMSILVHNKSNDSIAATLAWFFTYFLLMTIYSEVVECKTKPEEVSNDAS
jgi:hypothetical protein